MEKRTKDESDRLSNLPEPILHHIFSFLPINYMVPLTLVSKRLMQSCLSSPYLKFAFSGPGKRLSNPINFCSFVDKFMSESSILGDDIHSFYLSLRIYKYGDYAIEWSRVCRWIQQATESNVEELKLELVLLHNNPNRNVDYTIHKSISTILNCTSLRVLEIYFHDMMMTKSLEFPSVVLSSLESLTLKSVAYEGKVPLTDWVSTSCPSLKTLALQLNCFSHSKSQELEVTHHVLEDLKIFHCSVPSSDVSKISISCNNLRLLSMRWNVRGTNVKISAPNLQVLELTGDHVPRMWFRNIDTVIDATINIRPVNHQPPHRVVELFKLLRSAKVLHLGMAVIESLYIHDLVPANFDSVNDLEISIEDSLEDYHIQVVENFITKMPNLESLTIRQTNRYHDYEWETKVRRQMKKLERPLLIPRLKEMKIEFDGCVENDNDIKLVEYFLQTMDSLEKLVIWSKYAFSSTLEAVSAFLEKNPKIACAKTVNVYRLNEEPPSTSAKRCFEFS